MRLPDVSIGPFCMKSRCASFLQKHVFLKIDVRKMSERRLGLSGASHGGEFGFLEIWGSGNRDFRGPDLGKSGFVTWGGGKHVKKILCNMGCPAPDAQTGVNEHVSKKSDTI